MFPSTSQQLVEDMEGAFIFGLANGPGLFKEILRSWVKGKWSLFYSSLFKSFTS